MNIFPNAKIVLTVRDPAKWYESVKGTIYKIRGFLTGPVAVFFKLSGRFRVVELIANQFSNQTKKGVIDKGTYIVDSPNNIIKSSV